jgi:hypothetical protein
VALWRDNDPEVFKATIATAAEQLGVQPIAVEKDYWVCEVLRAIVGAHGDEVVFKGGTSLEKMRIIQRLSEDLDLLVVDIWALLHEPSVTELLADKAQVGAILQSIFEVSEQFSPDHPVPTGGFAASDAFSPDGEFAAELRRQHDSAMRNLYYGSDPPTFDDVIDRVHSCGELLNS